MAILDNNKLKNTKLSNNKFTLLSLYALAFLALFIVISYKNFSVQRVPDFHYEVLAGGQWQVTDNNHPTMDEGTIVSHIRIDNIDYLLSKEWLIESFYQLKSQQYQHQALANENLLYQASAQQKSITLIDTQGQSHGFTLNDFHINNIPAYTWVLYGIGWLKFIIGFVTASVGRFNANKLIFLLATSIMGLMCFYSVSTLHRFWAVNPEILFYRLSINTLGFRIYFFALLVLWMRLPHDLFVRFRNLRWLCGLLLITLIGTWAAYYFSNFAPIHLRYEILNLLPVTFTILLSYLVLYNQWRLQKASFKNLNYQITSQSNTNNASHYHTLEKTEQPTIQGGYKISQSLALRWIFILILMTGFSSLMLNILIQLETTEGDYALGLIFISSSITSIGTGILLLHNYLYRVEMWWWHIWGVIFACSLGGAIFTVLSASAMIFSPISLVISFIVGVLCYFVVVYYFKVKYAKTEAKLLTIAMPKLITINSKNVTINEINVIWQDILTSVFQPKCVEYISKDALVEILRSNRQSQYSDIKNFINNPMKEDVGIVSNAGETMIIQGIDDSLFILNYASNGLKLFNQDNLEKAQLLWSMVKQAHGVTLAYHDGEISERKRIACDLHDDIGGKLLYLSSQNGKYGEYAHKTLKDLRTLTHALSNDNQTLSLIMADVRYQIRSYCDTFDIELIFESTADEEIAQKIISAQASVNLICIINELTRNAIQNQSTTTLCITLTVDELNCSLCVENNGDITNPAEWVRGLGTVSTERRVNQLEGDISWNAKDEGGVMCQATWKAHKMYL